MDMILVDLETGSFQVESGIFEVGVAVIQNGTIIKEFHWGEVEDESIIHLGKGSGYKECSYNENFIQEFKNVICTYELPLVAHNAPFDRKFLTHYGWISQDYPFYDSIRAIKTALPGLESYSIEALVNHFKIETGYLHTACEDVEVLFKIIDIVKPTKWFKIGESRESQSYNTHRARYGSLDALKQEFEVIKDVLHGQVIVFTGDGPCERNKLIALVKQLGGEAKNSISKKTNILVVGDNPGKTKIEKAQELGIQVISMHSFLRDMQEGLK